MTREPAAAPILRRFEDLRRYTIGATDGDIGQVHDLLFDDLSFTVRYLAIDTGRWLPGRKVLISPLSIESVEPSTFRVMTRLTRDQVKASPDIDTARPVSRQHEVSVLQHYGYPDYWSGAYRWGLWPYPYATVIPPGPEVVEAEVRSRAVAEEIEARAKTEGDPHLHSVRDVLGHGIRATDGDLGHVEDVLVDDESWAIRYLVVDPRSWWPGVHVLASTEWVGSVAADERRVEVDVSREAVRQAPPYSPDVWVEREWERQLHRAHGRRGYWERPEESWRYRPPAA